MVQEKAEREEALLKVLVSVFLNAGISPMLSLAEFLVLHHHNHLAFTPVLLAINPLYFWILC